MVNNTRNDSGGSRKSLKSFLQSKSIQTAEIKKKINDFGDRTKNVFQSRSDSSKAESKDYSMGERQVGPYGFEKINISDDESEIFIFKRPDKMSFDDLDFTPYHMNGGNTCGSTDPVAVVTPKVEVPVSEAPARDTAFEEMFSSSTSAPKQIKVNAGVVGEDGKISVASNNNLFEKMKTGESITNTGSVPHMELLDDDPVEEPVTEMPAAEETVGEIFTVASAAEASVIEAPVEEIPEEAPEVDVSVIDAPAEVPVEEPVEGSDVMEIPAAEEPVTETIVEGSVDDTPVMESADAEDDDYSWLSFEDDAECEAVIEAPVEPAMEQTEAPVAPVAEAVIVGAVAESIVQQTEAPVEEAPLEVTAKAPEKIEVPETEISGLMMDGAKASSGSQTDAASVVKEELQTAQTGAEVMEPKASSIAGLTEDGEGRRALSDPKVRRPRTMRFKNGVLCNNTEPQEELRRPLE